MSCKGSCDNAILMAEDEIVDIMPQYPLWKLIDDDKKISRKFVAKNFKSSVSFFISLSLVAEEEGHHPDFHLTGYRNVEVVLSTHSIGGLSILDFVLASKLDKIKVDYSPSWIRGQVGII